MAITVLDGGQQHGPFELSDLEQRWAESTFGPATMYWQPGMDDWQLLAELLDPPPVPSTFAASGAAPSASIDPMPPAAPAPASSQSPTERSPRASTMNSQRRAGRAYVALGICALVFAAVNVFVQINDWGNDHDYFASVNTPYPQGYVIGHLVWFVGWASLAAAGVLAILRRPLAMWVLIGSNVALFIGWAPYALTDHFVADVPLKLTALLPPMPWSAFQGATFAYGLMRLTPWVVFALVMWAVLTRPRQGTSTAGALTNVGESSAFPMTAPQASIQSHIQGLVGWWKPLAMLAKILVVAGAALVVVAGGVAISAIGGSPYDEGCVRDAESLYAGGSNESSGVHDDWLNYVQECTQWTNEVSTG